MSESSLFDIIVLPSLVYLDSWHWIDEIRKALLNKQENWII